MISNRKKSDRKRADLREIVYLCIITKQLTYDNT